MIEMSKLNDMDCQVSEVIPKNYTAYATKLKFTDDRLPGYLKQIEERGFDNTELWSLDFQVICFLLPRLNLLKNYVVDDLKADIEVIIEGLELYTVNGYNEKVETALDFLRENFHRLWI